MSKKKKVITAVVSAVVIAAAVCTFVFLNSSSSSDGVIVAQLTGSPYVQQHTVNRYEQKNDGYASKYFDGMGSAIDGSEGIKDYCIPGLSEADGMIPQGIAYFYDRDWFLVTAYDENGKSPSVIYALDASDGKFVAQFNLKLSGKSFTGHIGGIGLSQNSVYISTENGKIGYIPLDMIYVQPNTVRDVNINDEIDLSSYLNGANTSYVTVSDGVLYTGNFYHTADGYDTPAVKDGSCNSLILGFKLSGGSFENEWNSLKKITSPVKYVIPSEISKIQCATVKNGKLYIVSSYGRRNDSELYIFKNAKKIDLSSAEVYKGIPMMEGFCFHGGELYFISESGAAKYNNGSALFWKTSKAPTDVIWKIKFSEYIT